MVNRVTLGTLVLYLKDQAWEENQGLLITNIDGLAPVSANINITPYAAGDGGVFNSSRRDSRNIVVTMKLGKKPSMQYNRNKVYSACPIGDAIAVEFLFDDNTTKSTYGYVESVTADYFGQMEGIQVSIICPNPDFIEDLPLEPTPDPDPDPEEPEEP